MHLVTRGHFQSRDKDGGHTIRSAIAKNPMILANFIALCFVITDLLPMEVLHCRYRDFTLTLSRWHLYMNLTDIPWRYTGCADMNFIVKKVIFWQTNRQTQLKLYTMPLHGWLTMAVRSVSFAYMRSRSQCISGCVSIQFRLLILPFSYLF